MQEIRARIDIAGIIKRDTTTVEVRYELPADAGPDGSHEAIALASAEGSRP